MNTLRPNFAQFATYNGPLSRSLGRELAPSKSLIRNNTLVPWTCQSCQQRKSYNTRSREQRNLAKSPARPTHRRSIPCELSRRWFSHSSIRAEEPPTSGQTETKTKLPSHSESRRSDLNKRLSSLMDHMQANIFIAGQRLNDLTGYSGIEALKKDIETQERNVTENRVRLQEAKEAYQAAINRRSASQREVNELLQRKNSWSPQDLERFTTLYRSDHANEQAETSAQDAVAAAEHASEEAGGRLSASILARYHEEQIWSDKIRRMSTWGTWGLMGVNVLLFLVFQIGVEPWRRKRLVKGFEDKVAEALEKEGIASNAAIAALREAQDARYEASKAPSEAPIPVEATPLAVAEEPIVEPISEQIAPEPLVESKEEFATIREAGPLTALERLRNTAEDCKASAEELFSHETVTVRRVDLTTTALEGAFVGVAITAIIGAIVRS